MKNSGIDRDNWPKYLQGRTIGMRGHPMDIPEGYEKLTTVKSIDYLGDNHLPDEVLKEEAGSGIHVVGKAPGKYAISMHHKGDPVILVNRALVEKHGFNPDKFDWKPIEG